MPTKRKIKPLSVSATVKKLDVYDRIVSGVWFVAAFIVALTFVTAMSSAMGAVVIDQYQRQISIGELRFNSGSRAIATGIATGIFQQPEVVNVYDVQASLTLPVANVLSYQLFTATSSSAEILTDMNVYGCLQQLRAEGLNRNTIFVGCAATAASPRTPKAGDKILARYYYIPGRALYKQPKCGNAIRESAEACDEGKLNGQPGRCGLNCQLPVSRPCPANFSLADQGDKCLSIWFSDSETSCLTQCRDTVTSYPNGRYSCYQSSDDKYRCHGSIVGPTNSGDKVK